MGATEFDGIARSKIYFRFRFNGLNRQKPDNPRFHPKNARRRPQPLPALPSDGCMKVIQQRKTNGCWAKGTSGNQSGRPAGSRNKATVVLEQMLEGEAQRLTRKVIDLALGGDLTALRLCMERLVPPRKDRPIHLDLPPIQTVQQISMAMTSIAAAISEGQITPSEGETVANILAVQKDVIATGELERRVEELEEKMSTLEEVGQ